MCSAGGIGEGDARRPAAEMIHGGCLCGGIRYEYHGDIQEISMCHCSMCRKAQGSAYVAVSPVDAAKLKITKGQELLKEFRAVPHKARVFCANCGSPIYSARDDLPGVKRLRIGTVETEFQCQNVYHTYVDSKAGWEVVGDGLRQYAGALLPDGHSASNASARPEQFRELSDVRQHADEPKRRWFIAPAMDLIVWVDELDRPFKFQLCYETRVAEYALTWEAGRGFNHALVDGGEGDPASNRTPILCGDVPFEKSYLSELFHAAHADLPADIGTLVSEALTLYPFSPLAAGKRPVSNSIV